MYNLHVRHYTDMPTQLYYVGQLNEQINNTVTRFLFCFSYTLPNKKLLCISYEHNICVYNTPNRLYRVYITWSSTFFEPIGIVNNICALTKMRYNIQNTRYGCTRYTYKLLY